MESEMEPSELTVAELVAKLQQFPPEAKVCLSGGREYYASLRVEKPGAPDGGEVWIMEAE